MRISPLLNWEPTRIAKQAIALMFHTPLSAYF